LVEVAGDEVKGTFVGDDELELLEDEADRPALGSQ
jgi:hypothetical protein